MSEYQPGHPAYTECGHGPVTCHTNKCFRKKWRVTVELPVEAPTATAAMDKVDAMFHPEQWRGMHAKPWRDNEYAVSRPASEPPEYQHPEGETE
jgi:hypothetical protein